MHLYVMHKREILLTLSGFISAFILLLFIGLAGPNATKLVSINAQKIFDKDGINGSLRSTLITQGPFSLEPPPLSTYSQRLCVWMTFYLKNEQDSEAFHTTFRVAVALSGRPNDKSDWQSIMNETFDQSEGQYNTYSPRKHQLFCTKDVCEPVQVLHLQYLSFPLYQVKLTFADLEPVHQKYEIKDIEFSFQTINPSFTTLCIWFRIFFLISAFAVGVG